MSNQMSADAEAYDKEYDAFVKQLEDFHQQRGTSFKRLPRINGKGIDLYLLYVVVTARGGWQKVNSRTEWDEILEDFRLPSSCINASTALKHMYIRYLDAYERINFLGEDGDEMSNNVDEDESRPMRVRRNVRTLNIVPLSYNHAQHNISEVVRTTSGMSTELYKNSSYDRLSLSLSCPLPNEHDFAFNMCTLLSNEGKHTLQLSQCPRLVEFMLAHTGVFRDRETQKYFISNYKEAKGKSLVQFWIDSVEDKSVLDLLSPECYDTAADNALEKAINHEKTLKSNLLYIKPLSVLETGSLCPIEHVESSQYADSRNEDQRGDLGHCPRSPTFKSISKRRDTLSSKLECIFRALACEGADLKLEPNDTEIFHLGRDLGLLDSEGTRISQVLHILRNLSFEEINVTTLAQSTTCLRFLVLCVCSRWGGLAVGALDTLGNIAAEIMLRDPAVDPASALLLTTICQGVSSQDRAFVLRSLEVLNKLAINDPNEEILSYNIEQSVYDQICRYLTIHDIMLLIYTLESLYSLSSLGMSACNAIVRAKGSVQTLISLLTVEAQSYGPEACIGMKVVETVTGVVSESENSTTTVATLTSASVTTTTTPAVASSGTSTSQSTSTFATMGAASVTGSSQLVSVVQSPVKVAPKPSSDLKRVIPRIVPPEVEEFVVDWVTRNYEACSHNAIEQGIVYRHFAASMHSLGRKQGLNPVLLSNCVRKVFGTGVGPSRRPVEDGTEKWHYNGIKRRDGIVVPAVPDKKVASQPNSCSPQLTPTPIIPASSLPLLVGSSSLNTATASPKIEKPLPQGTQGSILKAHLSAPLRNTPSPIRITHQGVMGGSLPPSAQHTLYSNTPQSNPGPPPPTQHPPIPRSDNSALIKSLLANKVTTSGSGSSFPVHLSSSPSPSPSFSPTPTPSPSEHSSVAKQHQHQLHHPHHQQQQQHAPPKPLVPHHQPKPEGGVPITPKILVGPPPPPPPSSSSQSSGPLPPISNIASFSKGPFGRQIGSLLGSSPPPPFGGKVAGSVISMGSQHVALPVAHKAAVQVTRNIQKQNGPADNLHENSTDAQSAKSIINGIKDDPHPDSKIVTSFEGILQNGIKEELRDSLDIKVDSAETSQEAQAEKRNLLADLLERTVGGDVLNGVVDKDIRVTEKGIQLVSHSVVNKVNGPIPSSNGQFEAPHGVKRPATPDAAGSVKRLAIEDPRSGSDSRITLYVSQNGNDGGEVLSQGHQVILNQGQQLQHMVPTQTQVVNTQTVVTPQGSMIIQRPPAQGNVIVQQSPHIISQGSNNTIIAQRNAHTSQSIFTTGSSSPILTQAATGQTQVISSGGQVLTQNSGQVFHQVIAHGQGGQKVILHGGQIGQVLGGQVLLPQSGGQSIVVQGGGNLPGQVIMQGVTGGTQSPVIVQGAGGHSQVLVHSSGGQGQVLLQSNSAQGQLVVSGGSQGQSIVTSNSQSPVVVTNSSGQTMIVAGSQGQQVVVGNSQAQQVVVNQTNQSQGQVVVQGNPVGNTVFLTPQQASQAGQKTLIILPNPKVMVAGNQPTGQVVLPRQVVQQIVSSSNTSPVISSSPIRTVRSVSNVGEISSSAYSSNPPSLSVSGVTGPASSAAPSGPTATPVTQSVSAAATHIPAPQILASGVARRATKTGLQYICEWKGCNLVFTSPSQVYHHACKVHCPPHITELTCHWAGCDTMVRKRFSAMTHIHDRHCNEQLMQILAMRRQQISVSGKTDIPTPQTPPPHPGYAPNAAFHAIKRHALEVINQRDQVEKEGPVTKSIRLTAALILRNLVIYSNMGKKLLRGYESDLANVAISSMESSRTVSQILYDIHLPDHQAL